MLHLEARLDAVELVAARAHLVAAQAGELLEAVRHAVVDVLRTTGDEAAAVGPDLVEAQALSLLLGFHAIGLGLDDRIELPVGGAIGLLVVDLGREPGGVGEVDAVHGLEGGALELEDIIAKGVLERVSVVAGLVEAALAELRVFLVVAELQTQRLLVAQVELGLQRRVADAMEAAVAAAVAAAQRRLGEPAAPVATAADRAGGTAEVAIADRQVDLAAEASPHRLGHEVDHAAHRLRAVDDLARALDHLDPLDALQRRVVVGCRVAVGRQMDRHAVLQQQRAAGAARIEAPDADVQIQSEGVLADHVHAGDGLQRLADRIGPLGLELPGADHRARSRYGFQPIRQRARHGHARQGRDRAPVGRDFLRRTERGQTGQRHAGREPARGLLGGGHRRIRESQNEEGRAQRRVRHSN